MPEPRRERSDVAAFKEPDFSAMQGYVETAVHQLFVDGDIDRDDFDASIVRLALIAMYGHADYVRIVERMHG